MLSLGTTLVPGALLGVPLGIGLFIVLESMTSVVLRKVFGWVPKAPWWVSNIPGTPTQFSTVLTCFVGPFPELNDFNAIQMSAPVDKPLVLRGTPPTHCRYWSFQAFLYGVKTHKTEQTLRDTQITLDDDGSYTVVLSKAAHKPAWATNWIPIPDDHDACILCERCYAPKPGVRFLAPDMHPYPTGPDGQPPQFPSAAAAVAAIPAQPVQWQSRVPGMWAGHSPLTAHGHQSLRQRKAAGICLALLVLWPCTEQALTAVLVALGVVKVLTFLAMQRVEKKHRVMVVDERHLVPNVSVHAQDPKGELKGHPRHLYYTLPFDARQGDVRIKGFIRGAFTYTSVIAYGWDSMPVPNFHYDETLISDATAAKGQSGKEPCPKDMKDDKFTVFLTTKPTNQGLRNEIDVTGKAEGLVLIRLIYPDTDEEIQRCLPTMQAVPVGDRTL